MANFNFAPTANGKVLFADVQAGAVLIPTKFVIGTGSLPSGKEPGDMTGVVTQLKELQVTKRTKTPDGVCIFGCVFTNEDITEDFYMRELALYARAEYRDESGAVTKSVAEVCMIYGNAGDTADLYPAYSTDAVVERKLEIASYVGANTQVELTLQSGVYLGQEEKGAPGGVAALDDDGGLDMGGAKVINLATPTDDGDAAPKSYVDNMLPKAGGTMTGPINMNMQRIHTLPNPTENQDAVPFLFADRRYGAPCNLLINSDFSNPVNSQGEAYYSTTGETIDLWVSYSGGVGVGVEDGYVNLRSESESIGEWYQPMDAAALKVGQTYTAAVWFTNGTSTAQQIVVGENQMVMSGAKSNGIELAISTISNRTGFFFHIDTGTTVTIEAVALYEGTYTASTLPAYRPIGYAKEALLCMVNTQGIFLKKDRDFGTAFPATGLRDGRFFLKFYE